MHSLSDHTKNALKIIENMGLILFVTSVGFIAGPKFFSNMKKNFKSYVCLGLIIIIAGETLCNRVHNVRKNIRRRNRASTDSPL